MGDFLKKFSLKCIRYALQKLRAARLALMACLVLLGPASYSQDALQAPVWPAAIPLTAQVDEIDVTVIGAWPDVTGRATVQEVFPAKFSAFTLMDLHSSMRFNGQTAVWLHLRLAAPADAKPTEPSAWMLEIPVPRLDVAELFTLQGDGSWARQQAGDSLANARWSRPDSHPSFDIKLQAGTQQDVVLRLRNAVPLVVPIKISSMREFQRHQQADYLLQGMVFGIMLLLLVICLVQGYVYRDRVYVVYAAYVILEALTLAAYTGLAAHFLWNQSPFWADASLAVLALLVVNSIMWLARDLTATAVRNPRLNKGMVVLGVLGVASAAVFPFVPRATVGLGLLGTMVPALLIVALVAAVRSWRMGDPVGKWAMLAFLPVAVTGLSALTRILGITSGWWSSQYPVIYAIALQIPLILIALNLRSRERHAMQTRAEAMATQDALTGLLAGHLFHDRVQQAFMRSRRHSEEAAVLLVSLVNYRQIIATHGTTVGEHSLLRAVIKLRRLLRDVDTAARTGPSQFGLILEGVKTREQVTQMAARLIALGLMPLKGLVPDVTLQFQFSAVLLREYTEDVAELEPKLQALLARISPRSRRPIRFLRITSTGVDASASGVAAHTEMEPESQFPPNADIDSHSGRGDSSRGDSSRGDSSPGDSGFLRPKPSGANP
jgi:two-component system, sensor histidine kinase LadS